MKCVEMSRQEHREAIQEIRSQPCYASPKLCSPMWRNTSCAVRYNAVVRTVKPRKESVEDLVYFPIVEAKHIDTAIQLSSLDRMYTGRTQKDQEIETEPRDTLPSGKTLAMSVCC